MRHPFLRVLEHPPGEDALRRWFGCEARWYERAMAALGCMLKDVPKTHRYVFAQLLMLIAEELDWLEVNANPVSSMMGENCWGERVGGIFAQGWQPAIIVTWLGTRLQYEALRGLDAEDDLAREYLERRTSTVIEAFLHDFEELADTAIEARGLAEASELLLRVVEGLGVLWDRGLRLMEGKE